MELVEKEEEEEDDDEEDEEDDEEELLEEELWVVEALDELVWVLDVALELDSLDVWVIAELRLSDCWLWAPTAGESWPPKPTAVSPPPASAETAARRAQRRATLIGVLPCSCSYRPLSAPSACFLTLSVATPVRVAWSQGSR